MATKYLKGVQTIDGVEYITFAEARLRHRATGVFALFLAGVAGGVGYQIGKAVGEYQAINSEERKGVENIVNEYNHFEQE